MLNRVMVTFPTYKPGFTQSAERPLVVVAVDPAGKRISQEVQVCNVREGRIYGNGMLMGMMMLNDRTYEANVVIDPRLIE